MKSLTDKIAELITPSLEAMGIELVQLKLVEGSKAKTLQVLAENSITGRITLDECANASRTISALLEVDDVISGAFNLEVSSPGIDRPLVKRADYEKYMGFEVKIETNLPVEGRRRFRGPLLAMNDDTVSIQVDNTRYDISLDNIGQAKLVLTAALLKAHQGTAPVEDNVIPLKAATAKIKP